jgi:hypothetical protein
VLQNLQQGDRQEVGAQMHQPQERLVRLLCEGSKQVLRRSCEPVHALLKANQRSLMRVRQPKLQTLQLIQLTPKIEPHCLGQP